jgi:hypothetical protein
MGVFELNPVCAQTKPATNQTPSKLKTNLMDLHLISIQHPFAL